MSELPNWVYDLVMDLQAQDLHPRLLFESGAFEGTRTYDWCACEALKLVPADVKGQAAAIAAYRREAERDKQPGSDDQPVEPHGWREFNEHGNTCHYPGCTLNEDEHHGGAS